MNTQVELLMLDMNKLCETITIDTMGARRGGGGGGKRRPLPPGKKFETM